MALMDKDIEQPKVLSDIPSHLGITKMARSQESTRVSYFNVSLTQQDILRLVKENSLQIREGEFALVPKDTPLIGRYVLDEKGELRVNKDGKPIVALYTVCACKRRDGEIVVGRVTLSWLSGEDLVQEDKCPLLRCKDGDRKYAGTYQLTRVELRDFTLQLQAGDKVFPYDLCLVGEAPVEGYKLPSFDQVWQKVEGTSAYVNVPEIKNLDSLELTKVRRASLRQTDPSVFTKEDLEVISKKIKLCLASMRLS